MPDVRSTDRFLRIAFMGVAIHHFFVCLKGRPRFDVRFIPYLFHHQMLDSGSKYKVAKDQPLVRDSAEVMLCV